jgi:hypothetical protein
MKLYLPSQEIKGKGHKHCDRKVTEEAAQHSAPGLGRASHRHPSKGPSLLYPPEPTLQKTPLGSTATTAQQLGQDIKVGPSRWLTYFTRA